MGQEQDRSAPYKRCIHSGAGHARSVNHHPGIASRVSRLLCAAGKRLIDSDARLVADDQYRFCLTTRSGLRHKPFVEFVIRVGVTWSYSRVELTIIVEIAGAASPSADHPLVIFLSPGSSLLTR